MITISSGSSAVNENNINVVALNIENADTGQTIPSTMHGVIPRQISIGMMMVVYMQKLSTIALFKVNDFFYYIYVEQILFCL